MSDELKSKEKKTGGHRRHAGDAIPVTGAARLQRDGSGSSVMDSSTWSGPNTR